MGIVLEKHLTPSTVRPGIPQAGGEDFRLGIAVVYTSVDSTIAALKHAGTLADPLDGRITLLVLQIVPYPLPLTSPPVLIDWNERRFQVIAETCQADMTVRLCFCRNRDEALQQLLVRRSLVVLGGQRRWWRFSAEERLARNLRRCGHKVILIETER